MENNRKTVGLTLGSGVHRGLAHIGVIKALIENKIPINYIAGSSIGAVVSAYYALNLQIDGLEKLMKELSSANPLDTFFDFNDPKDSLIQGEKIRQIIYERICGDKTFDDTKIPLRIVATDIDTGKTASFRSGKILDAILPSISIPAIFPAVEKFGMHLVDGGVTDPLGIKAMQEFNPDITITVDLIGATNKSIKSYNTFGIIDKLYRNIISADIKSTEILDSQIIIRPRTPGFISTVFLGQTENAVVAGYQEMMKNIGKVKNML